MVNVVILVKGSQFRFFKQVLTWSFSILKWNAEYYLKDSYLHEGCAIEMPMANPLALACSTFLASQHLCNMLMCILCLYHIYIVGILNVYYMYTKCILNLHYRVFFFTGTPLKKYGKPRLGESTLT